MQRDQLRLVLDDGAEITLTRVRDPRAKRIKLSVNERGARLTLPLRASLAAGAQFVEQHRDWLAAQLTACDEALPVIRDVTTHLPLRGRQVPVHWQQGRFVRLIEHGDVLHFSCPASARQSAITRTLRDFYIATARADMGHWLPKYLPGLPRPPSRIRLKVLSSQWGSLAPDGTLTLDLALILGEPFAFEYVLVHELCHLIHANHSPAFWNEVKQRCPEWHSARDYLRDQGRGLKTQLHTLLSPLPFMGEGAPKGRERV